MGRSERLPLSLRLTATKLTFVLALLCIAIVGYLAVAYVHFFVFGKC